MKKRVTAFLMILVLCFGFLPEYPALAANTVGTDSKGTVSVQRLSDWVISDLGIGDTYGIYPLEWYKLDMTAPVTQGKLWRLIAGMRCKFLESGCVKVNPDVIYDNNERMTVKEVLSTYYSIVKNITFTSDLGFQKGSAIENLKQIGVYKGTGNEPKLKDICSLEEACVYATRIITYVYYKLDIASKGFLWEAKLGENTVYMLGSIHMATTDIYPLSQDILNAYHSSNVLAVEVDLFDSVGALSMTQLGMYTDGTTLKDHVSDETYQKVIALAKRYGYTETMISMFKPWYIDAMFTSLAYTESGKQEDAARESILGVDMNFLIDAYYYGKPVLQVEGYEYQAKVFDSFSAQLQEYMLNDTLDSLNASIKGINFEYSSFLKDALQLWHDGNTEGYKKYSALDEAGDLSDMNENEQDLYKEYQNKLLTQRDLGMTDYIEKLLKAEGSSTYFVILGSSHYISDYSVIDRLKERGFEITQIK